MSEIKDGGPAFPGVEKTEYSSSSVETPYPGMTLRDYMAAKAMQGFCANSSHAVLDGEHKFKAAAKEAYLMADAMLRAREA